MVEVVLVALGGSLGCVVRYLVGRATEQMLPGFPLGTLLVNAAASFAVGVLLGLTSVNGALPERPRLFINVGILGGLSTCSAFSAETFAMLADGRFPAAFVNITLNVGLSLALVAAGWWIAVSTAAALSR